MTVNVSQKVECRNPNTGGKMNIDKEIYALFSKAIYHSLEAGKELTYTQLVEEIKNCFRGQNTLFNGSVGWYAVTVKNDMEARGIIEVFTGKRKKLHRLKK